MPRIMALSARSQTPSVETPTLSPLSAPPTESAAPVVAPTTSDWDAQKDAQCLVVVRRVPCVVCCPRKRARCPICVGTGIREARYEISTADAIVLRDRLTAMLAGH